MDNLALANVVQPTNSGPSPTGVGGNLAGAESSEQGSFGEVLAKQIAAIGPKANATAESSENIEPPQKLLQPIDLMLQIVDPSAFSTQITDISTAQQFVIESIGEPGSGKGKSLGMNEDDGSDLVPAELLSVAAEEGVSLTQIVGNVQPTMLATGKELPKSSDDNITLPLQIGRDSGLPKVIAQSGALAPSVDVSQDVEGIPEEFFSVQLDQALSSQNNAKGSQDGGGNLIANTNSVTPTTQRIANSAPSSAGIPQQVGTPHWDTGLGDKVIWMIGSQMQTAQLHLNPPSLGPLEVRVSMSDGQANLTFMTQQAVVKEAIDAATPRLREMMVDGGVQMGSVSVNVGNFSQQQQQAEQQSGSSPSRQAEVNVSDGLEGQAVVTTTMIDDGGLVNLFA